MKCHDALDRIDDLVDAKLPEEERLAVEAHLESCPSCREEYRRLRVILADARKLPREMTPPRDLWPEVAREIGGGTVVRPFVRRQPVGWWMPALAAAVVVLAVSGALWHRGDAPTTGTTAGTQVPVAVAGHVELLDAEEGYAQAANELLAALSAQNRSLSAETRASVERNLAVIDQALTEIREAIRKEPKNPDLTRMLAATHRKKVDVLRRVVRLSTSL